MENQPRLNNIAIRARTVAPSPWCADVGRLVERVLHGVGSSYGLRFGWPRWNTFPRMCRGF